MTGKRFALLDQSESAAKFALFADRSHWVIADFFHLSAIGYPALEQLLLGCTVAVVPASCVADRSWSRIQTMLPPTWITYGTVAQCQGALIAGARDFLVEPWSAEELDLRARVHDPVSALSQAGIEVLGNSVGADSRTVQLLPAELHVFWYLVRFAGEVVSRELLAQSHRLNRSSRHPIEPTRAVDMTISRLRKRLNSLFSGDQRITIESVRGSGYRLWIRDVDNRWKSITSEDAIHLSRY